MRRFLQVAALLLCLGAVGCNENDPGVKVANGAVDVAQTSPVPWVNLIGTVGGIVLGAFGLRKAGQATAYTESEWSRDHLGEWVDGIKKYPELLLMLDKALEQARKGQG